MKLSLLILLLAQLSFAQDLKLFFPELDAILITVWQEADNDNLSPDLSSELGNQWRLARPFVLENVDPAKVSYVLDYLDEMVANIGESIAAKRPRYARAYAWELLRQFRKLRTEYTSYAYPLDLLFKTYESFQEVEYVINDRMFGLYYWFEFKDLNKVLDVYWQTYDAVDSSELVFYYPDIDLVAHAAHKHKFQNCLNDFYDSLETAYVPGFRMPCEEMGDALLDLIGQYRKTYNHEAYINRL